VFFVLQPLLSHTGAGNLDSWRIPFGGFAGLLGTTFKSPSQVFAYVATSDKLKYLLQLLAPLAFLPLLTARSLVVLPAIVFNLLSTFYYQTNLHYHYTSLALPVLSVMAVLGLERFKNIRVRHVAAACLLLATLFSAYLWGPWPHAREAAELQDPLNPQAIAAAEAVSLIPADAVVASRDKFASHLTRRGQVYMFPTPFAANSWGDESLKGRRLPMADEVDYVIELPDGLTEMGARVWGELPQEGFTPIYDNAGVVLLKRDAANPPAGLRE
jgi:uncharacterized membrane protein